MATPISWTAYKIISSGC